MLNVFLVRSNLSNSLLMQVRLGEPLLWKVEGERLSSMIVRKTSSQSSLTEIIIKQPNISLSIAEYQSKERPKSRR